MNLWWMSWSFLAMTAFRMTPAVEEQRFAEEPGNKTAVFGSRVVLPCRIHNRKGIVQWTMNDFGLGDKRHLPGYDRYSMIGNEEDGEYSLEIFPVTLEDEGNYQCQVSADGNGQSPLRSKFAWLTVVIPAEPPVIVQGEELVVVERKEFTLDCVSVAGRPAAEITWTDEKGHKILENVAYRTKPFLDEDKFTATSTLTLTAERRYHNAVFTCQAQNGASDKPYPTAKITVKVLYAPKVTVSVVVGLNEEWSGRIAEGRDAKLFCKADANPPEVNYKWYVGNQLIFGEETRQLTIRNVSKRLHNSVVGCKVYNLMGESFNWMTLNVSYGPNFLWKPENVEANLNENVTLICDVEGNPMPKIIWNHGDSQKIIGRSNTLTLTVAPDTVGIYYCRASVEGMGEKIANASVFMNDRPFIVSEEVQYGALGGPAKVECVVKSIPLPSSISWTYKGIEINPANQKYSTFQEHVLHGVKAVLVIYHLEEEDLGAYKCSAINSHGLDSLEIHLKAKSSFLLVVMAIGIILSFLLVAAVSAIVFLSRRSYKSKKNGKNLCLSDDLFKGSDCKLELVTEGDRESDYGGPVGCGKNGFCNQIDVTQTTPTTVGTFKPTMWNSSCQSVPEQTNGTKVPSSQSSKALENPFTSKVKLGVDHVSYIGYSRDYSPPEVKNLTTGLSLSETLALQPFSNSTEIDSKYPSTCGADYTNTAYLSSLDCLLPPNLLSAMGNPPRLPCTTVWQDFSPTTKTNNSESSGTSVCTMPDEMTLL